MRPGSTIVSTYSSACLVLALLAVNTSAYFIIDEPALNRQWPNNAVNLVTWSKGVLDGVNGFDVEMAQMGQDGLRLVARNVPSKPNSLNIMLQDIPAGDDYFLIFINSTHGVMHSTSSRFSILAASASPSSPPPAANPSVPTVTISGTPNPTQPFATTFPAILDNAGRPTVQLYKESPILIAMSMCFIGWLFGALWTLGW
ncbi:hypothetical protein CPB83DRAFT_851873 [Crepidotus variabilis]|uniref:Uncharacterized protein n=1 Tax=Crepidotus variabilis TaxID=179855 RepID=A0A9P6EHV1_9AGAR|nr:hypothetical protein CPB83DRAFT_851873 [Crepidotus variabilis]